MKSYKKLFAGIATVSSLLISSQASAALTLVDENFVLGTNNNATLTWTSTAAGPSNGQQWIWSSPDASNVPNATEVWVGTGGATARGLSTTYNHDQNGGTANINIPGGIEIMSNVADAFGSLPDTLRAAVRFVLPANTSTTGSDNGDLSFFIANRIGSGFGGQGPLVELFNVTDNRSILAPTSLAPFTEGNTNWTFKFFNLDFIAADLGDTLELRFQETISSGGSAGARGLQVADITLSVDVIPEPASAALLALGGLALMRRRRLA